MEERLFTAAATVNEWDGVGIGRGGGGGGELRDVDTKRRKNKSRKRARAREKEKEERNGITMVTVAHQRYLFKYHKINLHLSKDDGVTFRHIDESDM